MHADLTSAYLSNDWLNRTKSGVVIPVPAGMREKMNTQYCAAFPLSFHLNQKLPTRRLIRSMT